MKDGTIKASVAPRYLDTEGDVFATAEGSSVEEVLGALVPEIESGWEPERRLMEVELVLTWSGTRQAPLCGPCGLRGRPVQGHCPFCGAREGSGEKAAESA